MGLVSVAKGFGRSTSGSIVTTVAIMLPLFMICCGVAVDFSRQQSARTKLQEVADTAALRAAVYLQGDAALTEKARRTVASGLTAFGDEIALKSVQANQLANGHVAVDVSASMPVLFLQFIGVSELDIEVASEAAPAGVGSTEIVIALDATTSMGSINSRGQAYDAIEDVLADAMPAGASGDVFVTLLPYSDRVMIPTANERWATGVRPTNWRGCLAPREEAIGGFAFALDDDDPASEPFQYWDESLGGNLAHGGAECITPFTGPGASPSEIRAALSNVSNDGSGRFDVAIAWGWRLLSPKWRGEFSDASYPSDYGVRRKMLFVITDFATSAYLYEVRATRSTTGANNTAFDVTPSGRDHLMDLCERVKATGVELWLIGVNEYGANIPYFTQCAGSRYISVDDLDDLTLGLRSAIGSGDVRLVR